MKNFFNRREEEIEEFMEEDDLDIINLDETSGWSKLEVAEELAKQQAANLMEEIGDELAIIDVVEDDIEIEKLAETLEIDSKEVNRRVMETAKGSVTFVDLDELEEEELAPKTKKSKKSVVEDDDIEYINTDDDIEYMTDDEEEEDEEEYEEYAPFAFFENIGQWFAQWTVLDKIVAATGVIVLAVAILTVGVYAGKRGVDKQVAAFAPVGAQLETVGVVGSDKLLAVADSRKAMLEAAKLESELNQEYEENDLSTEVKVIMKMTSVQKDLKIKFVNKKTGKLVGNVPFEVEITDSENKTYNKIDEDKDGIIYLKDIVHGNYQVAMVELDDMEGYSFSTAKEKIKVKENIAYEKIDVTEEIKDQSEVDVSKEDTAQKLETEGTLTDTVEWVASTKKESSSEETYTKVSKDTIGDPSLSASLKLDLGILRIMQQSVLGSDGLVVASETPVAVSGVSLSGPSSVEVGKTIALTATVEPSDATNKNVSWSSDKEGIATVSNGTVTGVSAGTATITVTTEDGSKTATCTVTVSATNVAVTGVSLDKTSATLKVGETTQLTATVEPSNASNSTVTWSTSDAGVAEVNGGTITAKAAGTATITAEAGGQKATCSVTVTAADVAVTGVSLNKATLNLTVGGNETLSATVTPSDATAKTVSWKSSDEKVATVVDGKVTAVAKGTATITAKAGDKEATCTVTVAEANADKKVTGVKLNKDKTTIKVGLSETLGATVEPLDAKDKSVTWSSDNTAVATVDKKGVVTAVKEGTAKITAKTTNGGFTATCEVTVTAADTTITLDKTSATMKTGETLTLKVTATPSGSKVVWKSSDEKLATVDSNGNVKAVAEGKVTISANIDGKNDVIAKCEITISKAYDPKTDTSKALKDKSGNQMYVLVDGKYVEAKVADYWKHSTFYKKEKVAQYIYTGWQNIDGKTYFFDKNGNKVTGEQVIQGAKHNFNSDGSLNTGSGILGIDVSTWNGNIDWNKVKNSGVSYVIIRTGFRGSTQGSLVEDNKFRQNIQGATNAGLKVGVYFFSQAVNEVEAVEEASMVLSQVKGYKLTYPVFIDVEPSGGRADKLSSGERTKVINAFCQTIQNGGLRAGVYANKTWLNQKMNVSALSGYKIWLAQYNSTVTYGGRYDMWQYSDKGSVAGISGKVDMNLSYLSY